jgi:hypothetical protein
MPEISVAVDLCKGDGARSHRVVAGGVEEHAGSRSFFPSESGTSIATPVAASVITPLKPSLTHEVVRA